MLICETIVALFLSIPVGIGCAPLSFGLRLRRVHPSACTPLPTALYFSYWHIIFVLIVTCIILFLCLYNLEPMLGQHRALACSTAHIFKRCSYTRIAGAAFLVLVLYSTATATATRTPYPRCYPIRGFLSRVYCRWVTGCCYKRFAF